MLQVVCDLGLEPVLAEPEITQLSERIIAKADRDSDGQLNESEFLYFFAKCLASSKKRRAYAGKVLKRCHGDAQPDG